MDWNGIRDWITAEGTGHWFFAAFPVLLLTLFIWFRERRVRFLIPSLLITIVIVNPVFYNYWDQMGLYAYWRILWIVPVIPVLASLVPSITERMQKPWVKCTVVAVGLGTVALSGTLLYSGPGGRFVNAANAAKLPDEVVEVADRLLELEERPRVVLQHPLGVYIRQYSGEINQLYGRDITGFIWRAGSSAVDVHNKLTEGDLNAVATAMANDQYEYLITDRTERLSENGFEALDTVADYGIYRAHGKPTVVKERNELGQVVKVINVDENGQPVNNESGYATIEWQYDSNGNIAREFRSDINGIGIADSNGWAGYERNYDYLSHVIMERMIGPDGKPVANNYGYAEVRREYNGSNLVRESYYDADGLPVNRIDTR